VSPSVISQRRVIDTVVRVGEATVVTMLQFSLFVCITAFCFHGEYRFVTWCYSNIGTSEN